MVIFPSYVSLPEATPKSPWVCWPTKKPPVGDPTVGKSSSAWSIRANVGPPNGQRPFGDDQLFMVSHWDGLWFWDVLGVTLGPVLEIERTEFSTPWTLRETTAAKERVSRTKAAWPYCEDIPGSLQKES